MIEADVPMTASARIIKKKIKVSFFYSKSRNIKGFFSLILIRFGKFLKNTEKSYKINKSIFFAQSPWF